MPVAVICPQNCEAARIHRRYVVTKGNEQILNRRNGNNALGRPLTRRRLSLEPVPGDTERYRTVDLEIVPDAIREFIDTRRVDARKRVELAR